MTPSPFRSPAGGIWTDLFMVAEPSAVSQARRFTESYLCRRRLTALSDTVVLVRLTPAGLFVEVWDGDPRPPVLTRADALDEGGQGLALVAALAKAWDHYPCDKATTGKVIWAEIAIDRVTS
jgi:hypothetical protein